MAGKAAEWLRDALLLPAALAHSTLCMHHVKHTLQHLFAGATCR